MFDDLRAQAGEVSFEEENDENEPQDIYSLREVKPARKGAFLGMTPGQRFLIAVMLLMMTCILGTFSLLVTGRLYLPFV